MGSDHLIQKEWSTMICEVVYSPWSADGLEFLDKCINIRSLFTR